MSIKLFISSVQSEFAEERQQLCEYISRDALLGRFFEPYIFENNPASDVTARDAYLRAASQCDIYLAMLGSQYGYEDEQGVSPTEREYDEATSNHNYRIIFIKNCEERHPKEIAFIAKVESSVIRKSFGDYEELRMAVYASLVRYLEEKEYIRLLPFDATLHPTATLDDLDEEKIWWWLARAQEKRNFPMTKKDGAERILKRLDLISDSGRLTHSAILLFGRAPQHFFLTSEVRCVQFYGYRVQKPAPSYQVYRGTVFEMIDQAVAFVMSRIDARIGKRDKKIDIDVDYELPLSAVTEAIVNAVVHRQYESNGSVQVMLFRDRLEIWNPGQLPFGLTTEKLSATHPSLPNNPLLANAVYLAGYIERLGTGTEDIVSDCLAAGLRRPEFIQTEDFRTVIWRKEKEFSEG